MVWNVSRRLKRVDDEHWLFSFFFFYFFSYFFFYFFSFFFFLFFFFFFLFFHIFFGGKGGITDKNHTISIKGIKCNNKHNCTWTYKQIVQLSKWLLKQREHSQHDVNLVTNPTCSRGRFSSYRVEELNGSCNGRKLGSLSSRLKMPLIENGKVDLTLDFDPFL